MSKRRYMFYLEDIEQAINNIFEYTEGYDLEKFLTDKKTVDAVLRNFPIIGEAANHIPKEIQKQNAQIDWAAVTGLRNRIVHEYFGVDYNIIWYIMKQELTSLLTEIRNLLENDL